jgi:hypothetical protein
LLRRRDARSSFDAHALPERNAALDFRGGGFWIGVIPGGVLIPHAVHFDVVIIRDAFPRTDGSVVARAKKFFFDRLDWKVLIPFHGHAGIALGNNFPAPRCFRHFVPRRVKSLSTEYRCGAELSRRQPGEACARAGKCRPHKRLTIWRKNSARMTRIQPEVCQ